MRNYTEQEQKELVREFVEEYLPYRKRTASRSDLADATIAYCKEKQIETVLTVESLRAGINNLASWSASPKDYLHFVFATNAALLKWFQTHFGGSK